MAATLTSEAPVVTSRKSASTRIVSIDALRGLVMFTMIFVNDIAGVSSRIVPPWMQHYHGRSGMTFVDLVFPAFLFIVGMSIPFGIGGRLSKGEPLWKTILHILTRTVALLGIGILMVNESPDTDTMGWSGRLWTTFMFLSAIFALSTISPRATASANSARLWRWISIGLRVAGVAGLVYLAFAFRGETESDRIITLSPFRINTEWYGILGLIGWAYFVGSMTFLLFRGNKTALLGCMVLLFCLYPADRKGAFENFWLADFVGIGGTLGSQAAITVAGVLLASILVGAETRSHSSRTNFTLLFIAGCAAAALLLNGLYGIQKNSATPSWCLWACAITAALWLALYFVADVGWPGRVVAKPLAIAGQNVILAYLLSEMLPSLLGLLHLNGWYGRLAEPNLACAIARSAGCAIVLLTITAIMNRLGFRLKL